jgi:hypothetical protein
VCEHVGGRRGRCAGKHGKCKERAYAKPQGAGSYPRFGDSQRSASANV